MEKDDQVWSFEFRVSSFENEFLSKNVEVV